MLLLLFGTAAQQQQQPHHVDGTGGPMQRHEVERLLRLRWELSGGRFGEATVEAWHAELERVEAGHAIVAMRRYCSTHASAPTFGAFREELLAHERGLRNRGDEGEQREREHCLICDGTRWREAPKVERAGVIYAMVEPCSCRDVAEG